MPYVGKTSCTHGIVVSFWLICYIQCGSSISYLSIPGKVAHGRCNIPHIFTFFFQFQCLMSCCAFHLYDCFSGGFKTGQRGRKVGGQRCEVIIICFKILVYLISRSIVWFFLSPIFYWVLLFNIFCFRFIIIIVLLLLLLVVLILLLFLLLLLLLLLLSFVLSSILFVKLCINVLYTLIFFFMPQVKDQQSYSLHLILVYFIFLTTIFRLIVFKFYDFVFLIQNH